MYPKIPKCVLYGLFLYVMKGETMDIISLLASDNYIVVNKDIIKTYGINTALLIGELASEYNYYLKNDLLDENGMFYSTIENVEDNIGLSRHQQKTSLEELKKLEIIDAVVKGMPAKRYIKLNIENLTNKFVKNLQTRMLKTDKQVCKKFTTNNNNITIIKNNNNLTTIYDVVEQNFNRTLTPIEYQKIEEWLLYYDEQIIKYAIEKSIYSNKKTFNYVNGILNNWNSMGYKTLQEIKENEENKQTNKNQNKQSKPEWYGKTIEKNEPTKEEQEEFERKLNEIING